MRYCLLASGSNGNACFVQAEQTLLLVDIGIGPRVLTERLAPLGITPAQIDHVLLTHEHVDHVRGLAGLVKRQPELVVHATRATTRALPQEVRGHVRPLRTDRPLQLGAIHVTPFITSHDVSQSVGYRLVGDGAVLGYVTDLGTFGMRVVESLSGADALVVESNHCPQLLAAGPYPPYLKRRVAGSQGHLSNEQCRDLLERLIHPGLRHVTLAHLSADNNSPAVALAAMEPLRQAHPDIRWTVGSRSTALPPVTLEGQPNTVASVAAGQLLLPW